MPGFLGFRALSPPSTSLMIPFVKTMIPTTNDQATHADDTSMCPRAMSKTYSGEGLNQSFMCSRGPAPACATSFHLARPSQLPLSDPPRDLLLPCPLAIYTLYFFALSSHIVCLARDLESVPEARQKHSFRTTLVHRTYSRIRRLS